MAVGVPFYVPIPNDQVRTTDELLALEALSMTTTEGLRDRALIQAIRDLLVSVNARITALEGA